MTESNWTKQGETLSHKNACKEFDLTEDQIFSAMKSGQLEFRQNTAHGNPYYRLLKKQVKNLAKDVHGAKGLKKQEIAYELKGVKREINSLKRKITTLEKTRIQLEKALD